MLNKIRQQIVLIQAYVDHNQRSPSMGEIAKVCQVTLYTARGIQRRYLLYRYISLYIETHGHPPSRREMSDMLHIPLSVIQYHLDKLVYADLLHGLPHQQRGISVPELELAHG